MQVSTPKGRFNEEPSKLRVLEREHETYAYEIPLELFFFHRFRSIDLSSYQGYLLIKYR